MTIKNKNLWVILMGCFIVVLVFFAFSNKKEKNNSKEYGELVDDGVLGVFEKIKEKSDIEFADILDKDQVEFTDDGLNIYEGKLMVAESVQTKLVEEQVNGFFEMKGFILENVGGVGGMQNLGGKKYEKDDIFCTTVYGVGSEVTGLTVSCASRKNLKEE